MAKPNHEQDLTKMTSEELMDLIDKDFTRLWDLYINKAPSDEAISQDCKIIQDNESLKISVYGSCTSESWTKAKGSIDFGLNITRCEVDFKNATIIDLGGVGSLLALRETIGKEVRIKLSNLNEALSQVFEIPKIRVFFDIA